MTAASNASAPQTLLAVIFSFLSNLLKKAYYDYSTALVPTKWRPVCDLNRMARVRRLSVVALGYGRPAKPDSASVGGRRGRNLDSSHDVFAEDRVTDESVLIAPRNYNNDYLEFSGPHRDKDHAC